MVENGSMRGSIKCWINAKNFISTLLVIKPNFGTWRGPGNEDHVQVIRGVKRREFERTLPVLLAMDLHSFL
jgi:hypothetical protein